MEAAVTGAILKIVTDIAIKIYDEKPNFKVDEVKQLYFNATKEYFQTYSDRHGQIQVLGMSKPMKLDAIYSGARMLDTESMKSYDSREALEKAYRNRGDRRFRHHDCSKRNGIDIANECERLIVLGDPGIGKSTFLRKVGLEALKGEQGSYKHQQIPVFLELKLFNSPDLDLEACIAAEFETCGFPSSKGFTKKALKQGRLLILFDGLDEVPADNLDNVIHKIQALVDRYSKNRFIASCRIAAYHTFFKRVNTVAIAEFDNEQIKKFITNWFSSELDQQSQTAQQCWELLQKPENKGAKELAQSPLLLTFLCMVYNKSLTVPSSRHTLYEDALNILLKEWASEKRVGRGQIYEGFHTDLEKQLLAKIAHEGFDNNQLFFSKEQLIKYITDFLGDTLDAPKNLDASAVLEAIEVHQGILVERATGIYSFSHLTLQEFLVAKYIVAWKLQEDLIELHVQDDGWREVFFLVTGLMGGAAIDLLERLELQTQELSEHPKLNGWLAWVEAKTSTAIGDYSDEIKRIIALILIYDLILVYNPDEITPLVFNLALNRNSVRDLANDLDLHKKLARDYALDGKEDRDLARDLALDGKEDRDLARKLDRIFTLDGGKRPETKLVRNLALNRAQVVEKYQLVSKVNLKKLIDALKTEFIQKPDSVQNFISIVSASLNISHEFLDISHDHIQVINKYLLTCRLMLDCSKQASGLSAQQWEAIKQRMFLPPQS